MTKDDHLHSVSDVLVNTANGSDVQLLADEEVAEVTGGPEVTNIGGQF